MVLIAHIRSFCMLLDARHPKCTGTLYTDSLSGGAPGSGPTSGRTRARGVSWAISRSASLSRQAWRQRRFWPVWFPRGTPRASIRWLRCATTSS